MDWFFKPITIKQSTIFWCFSKNSLISNNTVVIILSPTNISENRTTFYQGWNAGTDQHCCRLRIRQVYYILSDFTVQPDQCFETGKNAISETCFAAGLLAYETPGQPGPFYPHQQISVKNQRFTKRFYSANHLDLPFETHTIQQLPAGTHHSATRHILYTISTQTPEPPGLADRRCQLQGAAASVQETLKQLSPPRYTRW